MLQTVENQVKPNCGDDNAPSFATIWRMYPRRLGKQAATKAWAQLTPDQQELAIISVPFHVAYWKSQGVESLPLLSDWLSQWQFTNEFNQ